MEDERERQVYERGTDPTRVLALSDGVFAIILTLLVLEIHVPELGAGQKLGQALREIRPSLVAFLISFVVVAIAWAGHRDLFALIRRTDRRVAELPVPAAAVDPAVRRGDARDVRTRPDRAQDLRPDPDRHRRDETGHLALRDEAITHPRDTRGRTSPPGRDLPGRLARGRLVGLAVADAAPTLAIWIYALIPVVYFVMIWVLRSSAPKSSVTEEFT